jgi:hypothetical protein
MHDTFFIYCIVDECEQKESRTVIEGTGAAWPTRASSYQVSLPTGTSWAYRGRDGRVERAYCPVHPEHAACGQSAQAA